MAQGGGGMPPNRMMKNNLTQSMPELPIMNNQGQLSSIAEAAPNQESDVNYNHYVNN